MLAHESVLREAVREVVDLAGADLLKPEGVEIHLPDQSDHVCLAFVPGVGRALVARLEADAQADRDAAAEASRRECEEILAEYYQQAQGELSSALGRLIAIGEAYPDLKANENFRELQVQLEGTENRINVERNNFNKAVQTYNVAIRKFPSNLLAGIFGFEKMDKFEAAAGSENAPKVEF